ncbi:MAG: aminoacyl-tRNA hydrolase [Spirochaetia bacterium]
MNKSGTGVRAIIDYFSIPPGNTCIIHDDLETPFGTLAFSQGGGTGGHNGLKSIKQHIGTDFFRLKIGISRPAKGSVSSYVLSRFTQDEEAGLPRIIDSAADTLEELLSGNITTAQWKKQVLS